MAPCHRFLMSIALMVCAVTGNEFDNYLFAGSDKVTILTNIPAVTSQESNQFKVTKPNLWAKLKNGFARLFSQTKPNEAIGPEMELPEGTYNCVGGVCSLVSDNDAIDYARIKEEASRITQPGENDLTKFAGGSINFVDPPEILRNIDNKEMLQVLENEYRKKNEKKQSQKSIPS